jgi:RND family efflux transporter MFP subunit
MKYLTIILRIVLSFFIIGCSSQASNNSNQHTNEEETQTVSVTQWTDEMELFMEYPVLLKSTPGKFIIHLTILKDFQPIREGMVALIFRHQSGQTFQFKQDHLLRDGIFNPILQLDLAGEYDFTLEYKGTQVSESFQIDNFVVYNSAGDIPRISENGDGGITFLKEQQWKVDFQTETTQIKPIRTSIHAVGEVLPRQSSYTEITSPVEGFLHIEDNKEMVIPGSSVKKGQFLASLSPPLGSANSWTDRKMSYEQAKTEYERAQRLIKKNAISNREFEKIKNNYFIQKAGYKTCSQSGDSELFQFCALIDGIVTEIAVLPGQKVAAGQKLMTIVDPTLVWLLVNVFETDYYRMNMPKGLTIHIPGLESSFTLEGDQFRLLSMGTMLNSDSRTIPILLEIDNSDHLLKIGQTLQVDLYTAGETASLCIPKSAIFDDDTQQVVFLHKEGESFEKRVVETGSTYRGLVAILSGLEEGERVVTEGGYLVKLASTSAAIGHSHTH